eukprot:gene4901-9775_t
MEEVRHVFIQLTNAVQHMHDKGYLHGDIKPLNVVRMGTQWALIDLDASCVLGVQTIGTKSSTAYICPEAIYISTDKSKQKAIVKSEHNRTESGLNFDLLLAHTSFDVWSLGCILYQLCHPEVKPLLQGGQDDNISFNNDDEDNMFLLADWSSHFKNRKLSKITNDYARNLISQMLSKHPNNRPTLSRVLAHPFLSKKIVSRMCGVEPEFDVFLSYRVASDSESVRKLYDLLTVKGLRVWWDVNCLLPGKNWAEGFCNGIINSRTVVCLLSKNAIANYSTLQTTSSCDNVLLEQRLALELRKMGYVEGIFPVMIGDFDTKTHTYGDFFRDGCCPQAVNLCVESVETSLIHHMESQSLGLPLESHKTVSSVLNEILQCEGAFIRGNSDDAFSDVCESIVEMVQQLSTIQTNTTNSTSQVRLPIIGHPKNTSDSDSDNAELVALRNENSFLRNANDNLRSQLESLDHSQIVSRIRNEVLAARIDERENE